MSELERLSRRRPERDKPIRNWAELAPDWIGGPPRPAAAAASPPTAESVPGGQPAWPAAGGEPAPPAAGGEPDPRAAVGGPPPLAGPAGAVLLGYQVVEEHLRQGRQAAQQLGLGGGLGAGLGAGLGGIASLQAVNERLIRDGLLWLESVARLWSTFDPPAPAAGAPKSAAPAASPNPPPVSPAAPPAREAPRPGPTDAASPAATGFRVSVASPLPVEIDLELREDSAAAEFAVQDLRATSDAPAIAGATLARDSEGRLQVSLAVPGAQPAGVYHGVVFDRRDGAVRGTLTARLGGGPA